MHRISTRASRLTVDVDAPNATSLTLIDRIKVNDDDAWERLVSLYTPFLRYWCRRWGVSGADVDDVLQDVFQAVSKSLKDFRREQRGDSFRSWLRGITRNKVLSLRRRRGPCGPGGTDFYRRSLLIPDYRKSSLPESDGTEEEVTARLYEHALRLVKNEFEERTWRAFWRAAVDGQAPTIVAEDLGVTAAAVRQAKSRVLRRLKVILRESTPFAPSPSLYAICDSEPS